MPSSASKSSESVYITRMLDKMDPDLVDFIMCKYNRGTFNNGLIVLYETDQTFRNRVARMFKGQKNASQLCK